MNVVVALSIGASLVTGAIVNEEGQILRKLNCPQASSSSWSERSTSCARTMLEECRHLNVSPVAIGVSTKGNVQEGRIRLRPSDREQIPLKEILEREFKLPTEVMNRFHSLALGAHQILNDQSKTFGAIHLADGVGYGVVEGGKVKELYDDRKGAGGLQQVKRYSDGKRLSIAQIAGVRAIEAQVAELRGGRYSLKEIFDLEPTSRSARTALWDAADAVAELVYDLSSSFRTSRIVMMAYNQQNLSSEMLSDFMRYVRNRVRVITDRSIEIELINQIDEDDAKLKGAARVSLQRFHSQSTSSSRLHEKALVNSATADLYVVTGAPLSGKSTFLEQKVLAKLREAKVKVGGMISREVRGADGRRAGFSVSVFSPFAADQNYELTKVGDPRRSVPTGYTRFPNTTYLVNTQNIRDSIVPAIRQAVQGVDVILLDELAGMQLFSKEFSDAVEEILTYGKPVIVSIPIRSGHPLVQKLRRAAYDQRSLFMLQPRDREALQKAEFEKLFPRLMESIRGKKEG